MEYETIYTISDELEAQTFKASGRAEERMIETGINRWNEERTMITGEIQKPMSTYFDQARGVDLFLRVCVNIKPY